MTTTARGKGASGRLAAKAFLCLLVALFARQGYGQQTVVSDPLQALPSAVTDVQSAVNQLTNQSVVDPSLVPDQLIPSQLQQQNNGIPQQTNNPVPGVDNPQPAQGVGNPKPTDAFSNPQNIQGGGNPQTIQGGGNPLPIQGNGNAQPVQSGGNTQPTQSGGSPQIQNFVDPNKTPMNNFVSPGQQQGYNNNVNSQPEYSDPNQGVNNLSNNRPQQQIPQKTIMVTMIPPAQMHDPSLHFPVYNSPMLPQTFNQVPQFNGYQKPHASQNQMKYPTVGNGYPVYSSPNSGGGAQNWMSQFPGIPQLPGMPQIPGMPLLPGMSNGFGLPIESLMTAFNPMPYAQQPMGMATNTVDKMRDYTTGVRQGVGRVVYDVGNKILDGSQSLVHGMLDAAAVIPDKVFEMKRNGLNAFAGLLDVRPPTGINGNHYQHMSNGNYLYHHPTSAQVQQNPQHSEYQQQPQYSEYQQQQSQQQQPQQQQPQQQQFQQQQPQQQQLQQQQPQQQSQQQPVKNENSILDTPNPINEPQPIVRYGSVRNYQPARFIY